VGIHDNFFGELGGHSLIATRVMSRIRDTFQIERPLRDLFEVPTIAGLSERILSDSKTRSQIERAAELLLSLDAMPENELDAMLSGGSQASPLGGTQ
jgi:pyochelin synthetase